MEEYSHTFKIIGEYDPKNINSEQIKNLGVNRITSSTSKLVACIHIRVIYLFPIECK